MLSAQQHCSIKRFVSEQMWRKQFSSSRKKSHLCTYWGDDCPFLWRSRMQPSLLLWRVSQPQGAAFQQAWRHLFVRTGTSPQPCVGERKGLPLSLPWTTAATSIRRGAGGKGGGHPETKGSLTIRTGKPWSGDPPATIPALNIHTSQRSVASPSQKKCMLTRRSCGLSVSFHFQSNHTETSCS